MWTLALETTTAHGSLALLRDDAVVAERRLESQRTSVTLFGALKSLLAEAGLELERVGLFAVADGPGSFTGVRLGLTAVKGFVEVLGTPAVAVSTLQAVADSAGNGAGNVAEPTLAALDAGRGEAYYGVYPAQEEGLEPADALRERVRRLGLRAVTPHPALQAACPELELVGPLLAAAVGRLGLAAFRAGHTQDALRLDARYLRRSDAELFAAVP
ncbi:MAG TPA: tRNA (adenosine(37)-N6)-threonylcarbamoyltransferase complex dimerization subunit type 1 TsaB [Terriglobales bacterium]|nr:tRNA (adenosine(37)-N6)-threonylcarbamoyltransferase complex dimerization subunit type 1 TsaB [Terriglobales bacterium]HVA64586.1 tRNA (adenosine(37)-N6)-threonylcarbamoyltransferase complex dimerization subunit type 1 TsaB [Terriglobales bacterium]